MKEVLLFLLVISLGCSESTGDNEPDPTDLPQLSIIDSQVTESSLGSRLLFDVSLNSVHSEPVTFTYSTSGISAEPNIDFMTESNTVTIPAGDFRTTLEIEVVDDQIKEVEEKMNVTLSNSQNAVINDGLAIGIIKDNDTAGFRNEEGYLTSGSHYGYNLEWEEEFDQGIINSDYFNFEFGDHGWGNNELQNYSDSPDNAFVEDGKLIIKATDSGPSAYNSARLTTKGKKEFQFGRIDIRAKITKGQGIWPAIWMLGHNIDEVGWPACGEIDIMENVGHITKTCHGTVHWGPEGRGFSTFKGGEYSIDDDYANEFHVFSIVWENNSIVWYMDENKFYSFSPELTQGELYRFNQPFFFIFNVAVGGNWPGRPDDTTIFPQQMEIDYIRVFQQL